MAKYGRSASKNVESTMRRRKKGTLKIGSGRKVKSRKQAIAIGLNEARIVALVQEAITPGNPVNIRRWLTTAEQSCRLMMVSEGW